MLAVEEWINIIKWANSKGGLNYLQGKTKENFSIISQFCEKNDWIDFLAEDKLTRSFAEMENQRRRFEKEKDEAFEYGGFSFARETLNLSDNLERAKESLKSDESLRNSESLKKTLEHLEIIHKDILSIFKKNNIEPINSINKKLDPNYHQAMMEIEDDEKEPRTIVQEIQKGFLMKDRLLRPALVGVSKKASKKETINKDEKKNEENKEKKQTK